MKKQGTDIILWIALFMFGALFGAELAVSQAQRIVLSDIRDHNKFSAELATAMGMKQPDFLDALEGAKK